MRVVDHVCAVSGQQHEPCEVGRERHGPQHGLRRLGPHRKIQGGIQTRRGIVRRRRAVQSKRIAHELAGIDGSRRLDEGEGRHGRELEPTPGPLRARPRTDAMEFEDVVSHFSERFTVIDNNLFFATSHMMGARGFEVHLANYWPEWGIQLIDNLNAERYKAVQHALVREAMPFYKLWVEIEKTYTSGDGYLDKLCMELVGLDSSRCRPPTRDIREKFRDRCRQMLIDTGVPGVIDGKPDGVAGSKPRAKTSAGRRK